MEFRANLVQPLIFYMGFLMISHLDELQKATDTERYPLLFAYNLEAVCNTGIYAVAAVVAGTGVIVTYPQRPTVSDFGRSTG